MPYPVIVRFPTESQKNSLNRKCEDMKVSTSSVMVELAGKFVKGEVEVAGRKISDINRENRKGLTTISPCDITKDSRA